MRPPIGDSAPVCLACGSAGATPWASATDVEYCTTRDVFRYLRCAACGVLFIDPVPLDRLGEIYPPNYYAFQAPRSLVGRCKRWLDDRQMRRVLRRLTGRTLAVLDVGGGAGELLTQLRTLDPRIVRTELVDIDRAATEHARASGHEVHCGRVEDFRTSARFDLVVMLNLIEHVADPAAVLARTRDLLAPGGLILIQTPNHDSLDARIFRHRSWGGYHCPRHWVLFTPDAFRALAGRAGLEVLSCSFTQGAPFWAVSVLAWLAARGLVSISRERPVVAHPLFGPLSALFAAIDFARRPLARTSQIRALLTAAPDPAR